MKTLSMIALVLTTAFLTYTVPSVAGIYLVKSPNTASAVQDQQTTTDQKSSLPSPPEPALLALFGAGVLSMIGLGWIKRKEFTETRHTKAV